MPSIILHGRPVAKIVSDQLTEKIASARLQGVRAPKLAVILIEGVEASKTYVAAKERACREVGILVDILRFDSSVSAKTLASCLEKLNQDDQVDAILVQLPLPSHLDTLQVISWIDPSKDVDGLTPENMGRLALGSSKGFISCTPKGIVRLLEHYQLPTQGARVVILGRSHIVGRPLSILMSNPHFGGQATVTLAHSQTRDLPALCSQADILVAAIGKAHFVTQEMTHAKSIIIDVGINRNAMGGLCGDADFQALESKVHAITPVPGGIGPMTVAMLLENVTLAWTRHLRLL